MTHPALGARQIYLVALCAITFLIEGYDLQAVALALPTLSHSWSQPPSAFSLAVSAMIFGATLSSALIAPMGDVYGRKRIITLGLVFMGLSVCATATSSTMLQLQVWRFLSGLGFGAATVNVAALITEQLPGHRRNLLLTVASVAFSLGAGVGGFVAPLLLNALSWHWIFISGGLPPLVVAALLLLTVPESLQRTGNSGIRQRLLSPVTTARTILSQRWRATTATLWIMCVLNNIMLFVVVGWLPSLLTGIGWTIGDASHAAAMVQIGGIAGGLILTWLFDRGGTSTALVVSYCVLVPLMLLFAVIPTQVLVWSLMFGLAGATIIGGYYALSALAATAYPSEIRATAIGWVGAFSRVGSIAGSLVGGLMLHLGLSTVQTLTVLSVPAAISVLLALHLQSVRARAALNDPTGKLHSP